jgi:predicted phage tail component-like protein
MINYAGVDLGQYLDLRDIRRNILPPRENYSIDIATQTGALYNGFKYGERVIEVDFLVKPLSSFDYTNYIRDIATILDVEAPSRLYFADEPDKYYYAVVDGDTNISEIARGVGEGSITFVCYDPIAYSDDERIFTGGKSVLVSNEGTTKTYPVIDINFFNDATFAQVSNVSTGASILVGQWPNANLVSAPAKGIVINDPCTTLTDWLAVGNVLDTNRRIDGNFTINSGGYAITPSSFGTEEDGDKWLGPARRRNLGRNITDFEVVATIEFDSQGTNYSNIVNTPDTTTDGENKYKTTANLNLRAGRGTSYKIYTTIPKNQVLSITEISGGWGKATYGGITGYCSMTYLQLQTTTTANYRVSTDGSGLNLRSSRSSSSRVLLSIPNGTALTITEISGGWGKTTYNNKTGYVYMSYVSAQNLVKDIQNFSLKETADDKLGLLEIYGFDGSGNKLFRFHMTDANFYYEYTHPQVDIGNTTVLKDTDTVPGPRTETVKDDTGANVINYLNSGKFGKWNEFYGNIKIRRETINGNQLWSCSVDKIQGGQVVATLSKTSLANSSFPTGELNNLVLFIGKHKGSPASSMTLVNLTVEQLNELPTTAIPQIFKAGDKLTIDNLTNNVMLNDIPTMTNVDIGSNFFEVGAGDTELKIFSDDANIYTSVSIIERWL